MAVTEIVTHPTITIAPDDTLKRAMSLMMHHHVRHLPVIANGKLVGIVSIGDVVKHRLEDLETETNALRHVYMAAHALATGNGSRRAMKVVCSSPTEACEGGTS
jgi:predicted transcriptional regulator